MFKVVIADDEPRICQLIQALLDWDGLELQLAAVASNGLEALEMVKSCQADILITDIRMPGCNGIDLIEKAKAIMPQLEIVIISGYAHFEYAQTALRLGVGDYLLKPIHKEELNSTMMQLKLRCEKRERELQLSQELETKQTGTAFRQKARLVQDLAEHRISSPSRELLEREYQLKLKTGVMQVAYLKLDYDPRQSNLLSAELIKEQLAKITRDTLLPVCSGAALYFQDTWAAAILQFPRENLEEVRSRCRQILNKLVAKRSFFGNIRFSLALSGSVTEPEALSGAMEEAQLAIQERLLEGTERLLERVPQSSNFPRERLLDHYCRGLDQLLETQDLDQADLLASDLQEKAMAVPGVCGRELLELVQACGGLVILRTGSSEDGQSQEFKEHCNQCSSTSGLFFCLQQLQRSRLQMVSEQRQTEQQRPIRIAKQFIQAHYQENIGLEDLCAATGFSSSYFSAMFKKETGENFSKYLTRFRMEKAKELLQDTNLPISEICTEVGYLDLKHFNQTFKKFTSLTPSQYRKLYG